MLFRENVNYSKTSFPPFSQNTGMAYLLVNVELSQQNLRTMNLAGCHHFQSLNFKKKFGKNLLGQQTLIRRMAILHAPFSSHCTDSVTNTGIRTEMTQSWDQQCPKLSFSFVHSQGTLPIKLCTRKLLHAPSQYIATVFEIKGAPCTLCAHFDCRVHRF